MMPQAWTPVRVPGNDLPAAPVAVRRVPHPGWNTLRVLKAARSLLCVIDVLLLIVLLAVVRLQQNTTKTVGQDAVPSIVAAHHIKTAVAGMDANLANELLTNPDSGAPSLSNYDAQRTEAAASLVSAAENITYGESERGPIRTLENGLAVYEDLAEHARDLHETGKVGDPGGNAAMLDAYRQSETMTDRSLLPAADDLDRANFTEMERNYRSELTESTIAWGFVVVVGVLNLGALLGVQGFLSRRTRRTFNPALLGATVLTAGLVVYMVAALLRAQHELRVAKDDAFTSEHTLLQARATAYQAHGEQSRYLLDPAHVGTHEAMFRTEAHAMALGPPGLTGGELVTALRQRVSVDGFRGYLAEELDRTTLPGERESALDTLEAWQRYMAVDGQIRLLQQTGKHEAAVELCTGTTEGGADWALVRFDKALARTLAIDQGAFERAIADGRDALNQLDVKAVVGFLVVAVLVFLGLAPRIREYQ